MTKSVLVFVSLVLSSVVVYAQDEDIAKLVEQLDSKDQEAAVGKLSAMGVKVLPAVGKALKSNNKERRYGAFKVLSSMRWRHAKEVTPLLLQALELKGERIPFEAAMALAQIECKNERLIPPLSQALRDKSEQKRLKAIRVLGLLGPHAAKAVPALIKTLNEDTEKCRQTAEMTLGNIGPKAKAALPHLLKILAGKEKVATKFEFQEGYYGLHSFGISAISAIAPRNKDVHKAVLRAFKAKGPLVRMAAAYSLGDIGLKSKEAFEALEKASKDEDSQVREAAQSSLKKLKK